MEKLRQLGRGLRARARIAAAVAGGLALLWPVGPRARAIRGEPQTSGLAILTNRLHLGYAAERYDGVLTATGGRPPYHWSLSSGKLPAGLALADGGIRGTPSEGGRFALRFTVSDSAGATASKDLALRVFEQPLDRYRGLRNVPCPRGKQPHFYAEKIGQRWHLCTPAGNVFWVSGMFFASQISGRDDRGIDNQQLTNRKYASGPTNVGTLNWAYATARRLEAWGFNATAEYSSLYLRPTHADPRWPTSDHTIPIHLPYVVQLLPTIYSAFNLNHLAPGPVKNTSEAYKHSVFRGYMRGMADVFDPNFSIWLRAYLARDPAIHEMLTGPNHDYLLAVVGDEADNAGGFGPGRDFQTVAGGRLDKDEGHADAHWGWMTLISSPVVSATRRVDTPRGRSPENLLFSDPEFYSKRELGEWLQQTGDRGPGYRTIAQLNAAWGSSYDNFSSDAVPHTEPCASGDGTAGVYTCRLSHTPVTPLTLRVMLGGNLAGGDDGAGPRSPGAADEGDILGPALASSPGAASSVSYRSGTLSLRFAKSVAAGEPITVSYQTSGWGQGRGLADEDGTCPARANGRKCWVPADGFALAGAPDKMKQDLDNFLYHFARTYFAAVKAEIEAVAPGALYIPLSPLGSWGTPSRREILEASAPYADLIAAPELPPADPHHNVPDVQARIDFLLRYGGDKPWINRESWSAQPDSYLAKFPAPNDLFSTQSERGRFYDSMMDADLDAHASPDCRCAFVGTHPVVGLLWWAYYDSWSEKRNFGLATPRDDPYDGVSATPQPGADSWGYPTGCLPDFGCEQASYGDFLDFVIEGNLKALRRIAAGQ